LQQSEKIGFELESLDEFDKRIFQEFEPIGGMKSNINILACTISKIKSFKIGTRSELQQPGYCRAKQFGSPKKFASP
jgi:hypothetical protein